MRKVSLFFPIFWTFSAVWSTYRWFSKDFPRISERAQWITICDIIWLCLGFALAICYWSMYIKSKKTPSEKSENTEAENT